MYIHPTSTKVNVQLDFKVENKRKIKKSKKIKGFDSFGLPESQLGKQIVRGVKQWVDGVDIIVTEVSH